MDDMMLFDAPEARAPETGDLICRIAKADIRLCRGLDRKRDLRITFLRQVGDKYYFKRDHERWSFDGKVIASILDGIALPFGDRWFERKA